MKKIGVLGTGTMGAGIIQVLAQNGYEVVMRARRESSVEKGLATVNKNLDKMVAKEKITAEEKEAAERPAGVGKCQPRGFRCFGYDWLYTDTYCS